MVALQYTVRFLPPMKQKDQIQGKPKCIGTKRRTIVKLYGQIPISYLVLSLF